MCIEEIMVLNYNLFFNITPEVEEEEHIDEEVMEEEEAKGEMGEMGEGPVMVETDEGEKEGDDDETAQKKRKLESDVDVSASKRSVSMRKKQLKPECDIIVEDFFAEPEIEIPEPEPIGSGSSSGEVLPQFSSAKSKTSPDSKEAVENVGMEDDEEVPELTEEVIYFVMKYETI